ncbi:helix-turn-helix transcriptional regulator [Haloferax larsenii]|uniref:DUF7845 domain-containing protein n=1 Tax=Haloferax larsenii TaxID=302484 RepID=A0A1H7KJS1_HALLR|nr:hypothetical protein [Haloferax larsenii]SEK87049.1 hypothetical protein SAMN04488691_10228 [Haloferax larsenii]
MNESRFATGLIATTPHELGAHLNFGANRMSPYWALSKLLISHFDGHAELDVELPTGPDNASEGAHIRLTYKRGKIDPRADFGIETDGEYGMYEPRIHWSGHGQRKAHFHIRPRFAGMKHVETGEPITSAFDNDEHLSEGVNIHAQGSNLDPDEYLLVLRHVLLALAKEAGEWWDTRYFKRPLDSSRIHTYERYLRILREHSSKVVSRGGIISKLRELYATELGTETMFKLSNKNIVGYNHRVLLPKRAVQELPGLEYGVQLKHYHPEYVRRNQTTNDALRDPKIGALFKRGKDEEGSLRLNKRTVRWSDREELSRQLEEFLVNVVSWAGLSVSPGPGFVADDHFQNRESDRKIGLYDDPTPEMETKQDSILVRTLLEADEREREVLKTATDGGEMHYSELAEETDNSVSTVYRALEKLGGLLEKDNGNVRFVSQKLHEDLREIFAVAQSQVETARAAAASILDMDPNQLAKAGASLQKWMNRYVAEFAETRDDRLLVKINSLLARNSLYSRESGAPVLSDVVDELYEAWLEAGRMPNRLLNGRLQVEVMDVGGATTTSIPVSRIVE